jgi:hypothetical protein
MTTIPQNLQEEEQSLVNEFLSLETGEKHLVNLFGLVTVNFTLKWIDDCSCSIEIDTVSPSDQLQAFFNDDGSWNNELFYETIQSHIENTSTVRSFNEKISDFIAKVNAFGKNNYNDVDYFFDKHVWSN